MNNPYKSLENFKDVIKRVISESLSEFDLYQKQCFPVRPPEFFCLELNGEAGELANKEKKIWKGIDINHDELADEAADVFIALMNYSNSRNIDLGKAVANKLKVIEDRRLTL